MTDSKPRLSKRVTDAVDGIMAGKDGRMADSKTISKENDMGTKELFKAAMREMLENGEYDKLAKHYEDKADYILAWRDHLAEAEKMGESGELSNNLGSGIDALSITMLLGELVEHEPICADALCIMLGIEARDDR